MVQGMTTNREEAIFPMMLIRTAGLPLLWLDRLRPPDSEAKAVNYPSTAAIQQAFDVLLTSSGDTPFRTKIYNARKAFFQRRKPPSDAFMHDLEQETGPHAAHLLSLLIGWKQQRADRETRKTAYAGLLAANYRVLQDVAQLEEIRRSLLFISHDLLDRLPGFCSKETETFVKKDRQTALSVLQYLNRAVVKTSPLSRLTTVSLWRPFDAAGEMADMAELAFLSTPQSYITPNVGFLPALYEILLKIPAFYRSLSVSLNPCITSAHDRRWLYFDGKNESFQQIAENPVASLVMELLLGADRKLPFADLLEHLGNSIDADQAALESLLLELIDLGLLEWELPVKGLAPDWCQRLYQYLGFLPHPPQVLVDAAVLVQWLRTAAKTISFQSVEAAKETQVAAAGQAKLFFEQLHETAPAIPPEQVLFEDRKTDVVVAVPPDAISNLAAQLAECWQNSPAQHLPPLQARIFNFADERLKNRQTIDFLDFAQDFLNHGQAASSSRVSARFKGKIGALLQLLPAAGGAWQAVVNGLYVGGGKMFARWAHLFPDDLRHALAGWNDSVPFPWQGWSNANFQPLLHPDALIVPGGRTDALPGGRTILIADLAICKTTEGPQLLDKKSGNPVIMTDLGLEVARLRPPVLQLLWNLGMPYVSIEALVPEHLNQTFPDTGWSRQERIVYRDLVLMRSSWTLTAAWAGRWLKQRDDAGFFLMVNDDLQETGVPERFFVRFSGAKPQYFDRSSPVSMLLFARCLRKNTAPIVLTEMLPLPEHAVVRKDAPHAAEVVLELTV